MGIVSGSVGTVFVNGLFGEDLVIFSACLGGWDRHSADLSFDLHVSQGSVLIFIVKRESWLREGQHQICVALWLMGDQAKMLSVKVCMGAGQGRNALDSV